MENVLNLVWAFLNSPVVVTGAAGLLAFLLAKLLKAKPAWAAYEGTIIAGIKWAEKTIDDDCENKAMAKLDTALRYVLDVYEKTGRPASDKAKTMLKEGIQIKHAELEATNLKKG